MTGSCTLAVTSMDDREDGTRLDGEELRYYRLTETWNAKFWRRTGGPGDLAGTVCLDLGCGVGALTTDLVRLGAARATGIDPDEDRIRVARAAARALQADVAERVDYRATTIQGIEGQAIFDVIVSRDTFEHIHDLSDVLAHAARLLRPAGRMYVGFGPMYRSPFGDHGLLGMRIPWLHLLVAPMPNAPRFGTWPSVRRLRLLDRELNGLSLAEIRTIIEQSPLEAEWLTANVSDHPAVRALNQLTRLPATREYVAINAYGLLRHRGSGTRSVSTDSRPVVPGAADLHHHQAAVHGRGPGP